MLQTVAALIPAAVNYERTLVLAIEVSNKSWVLAAQVPGLPHTKAKRTIDPEAESLLAAISGYRARATATGRSIERVIAVYEAGWSGFWLARWLMRHGVEVYVVQPSPELIPEVGSTPGFDIEPISKSSEEDNEAGELDKAEEVLSVVLPADEDATLPSYPGEEALDEPASHVTV